MRTWDHRACDRNDERKKEEKRDKLIDSSVLRGVASLKVNEKCIMQGRGEREREKVGCSECIVCIASAQRAFNEMNE